MNFADLVENVVSDTGREDLGFVSDGGDGQILKAVFAAILAVHSADFFYKDISTAEMIFNSSAFIQSMDTTALPRFRALAYVRKWDPSYNAAQLNPSILPPLRDGSSLYNTTLALDFLELIDYDDIFDSYKTEKQDVMYVAGTTVNMKSSTSMTMAKIGWYAHPFLDIPNNGAGLVSWIAQEYPYAIIYKADSIIFNSTGDLDRSRKYDSPGGLVSEWIAKLIASNVTAKGR